MPWLWGVCSGIFILALVLVVATLVVFGKLQAINDELAEDGTLSY
jgi:hypothetical protein